jgi:hypothetical protein
MNQFNRSPHALAVGEVTNEKDTMQDIEDIITDAILPSAREIIQKQEHQPMFLIRQRDGRFRMVLANFNSQEEKIKVVEMVRKICREEQAPYFIFISEAWMIVRGNGYDMNHPERPSQAKDRKEVLQIIVNFSDGNVVSYCAEIKNRNVGFLQRTKNVVKQESIFQTEWGD